MLSTLLTSRIGSGGRRIYRKKKENDRWTEGRMYYGNNEGKNGTVI
jgi:hypothetical protein